MRALGITALLMGMTVLLTGAASGADRKMWNLELRSRVAEAGGHRVETRREQWDPARTALIVCDMWDRHWCAGANRRAAELAPQANRLIARMRDAGALIIHAPSGCMDAYRDHPARKRARSAPAVGSYPPDISRWCYKIPAEEQGKYPLDQADGGCDDQPACKTYNAWTRQMAALEVRDQDAISDSGTEIWNLLEGRGIRNVMILGVHLNMCVLGRPFGLRNMARAAKNVVLVRDLTDTMYNPRSAPFVPHHQGTALMVEHVEKWVCPTLTSDQILGGAPFRFSDAQP